MLRWPGEELVGGGVGDAGSFVTMAQHQRLKGIKSRVTTCCRRSVSSRTGRVVGFDRTGLKSPTTNIRTTLPQRVYYVSVRDTSSHVIAYFRPHHSFGCPRGARARDRSNLSLGRASKEVRLIPLYFCIFQCAVLLRKKMIDFGSS
jgi:hypothetical protein